MCAGVVSDGTRLLLLSHNLPVPLLCKAAEHLKGRKKKWGGNRIKIK